MSASLVGSEMCIRDRTPAELARPVGDEPREGDRPWEPGRPFPRMLGSVSYTHLTLPTICSV
eukprot:13600308-Alexandrium_andersonii.AAC.1